MVRNSTLTIVRMGDVDGGCPAGGHEVPMSRLVRGLYCNRWCVRDDTSPSAGGGQAEGKRGAGFGNMMVYLKLGGMMICWCGW